MRGESDRRSSWWVAGSLVVISLGGAGCGVPEGSSEPEPAGRAERHVPQPALREMEPRVAQRLREARSAVVVNPQSAAAWGSFGMVLHVHELWTEALVAYGRAEELDPTEERWPYYLGDVLSMVGTDREAAASAFRRALSLHPGYAQGHLRLGNVLLAAGEVDAAAAELERALELAQDLQPARLSLAQVRLSQGELELSAAMLEELLESEPRHAQALSTLGQVYMRQGDRDKARAMAQRVRSAAIYNLFSDPLMEPLVAEGVSSLLIWERAKAFLENGNNEQAVLGLKQVLTLQPQNPDAHQQIAVAYGNLSDLEQARRHLRRAVALEPDRVDALIQLAAAELSMQDAAAAIPVLERILELAPDDPDAPWLLGRAQLMTGDLASGLSSFAEAEKARVEVPAWARNDWGSALAQSGRPEDALEQFQAALRSEPENAQALFYVGLVREGQGATAEALDYYCRSVKAQPSSPAQARLTTHGRNCS